MFSDLLQTWRTSFMYAPRLKHDASHFYDRDRRRPRAARCKFWELVVWATGESSFSLSLPKAVRHSLRHTVDTRKTHVRHTLDTPGWLGACAQSLNLLTLTP
jgi:hypothetical protein